MSVFPRTLGKLNTQFSCQGLWTFDGNFQDQNDPSNPNGVLSSSGTGDDFIFVQDYTRQQCLRSQDVDRVLESNGLTGGYRILTDVTVQVVVYLAQFATDTGINLFSYDGDGSASSAENAAWKLAIASNADLLVPSFVWEHGSGVDETVEDTTFTLDIGRWYHIVGVREGTDARLYVNNTLVTSASGLTLPTNAANGTIKIGEVPSGVQGLPVGTMISSAKVSNAALSVQQINQEFNRVRGAFW